MSTATPPVQGTLFDLDSADIADSHAVAPRTAPVQGYRGPTVCQIAGVSYRQLDYWTRTGLVAASVTAAAGSGSQRLYSFRDILVIRIIKSLLDAGISLPKVRTALGHLQGRGVAELSQVTLMSDGVGVYECASAGEIVDLLAGGQGVFGIAVPGIVAELAGTISNFPAHRPDNTGGVDNLEAGGVDELAARRMAKATA